MIPNGFDPDDNVSRTLKVSGEDFITFIFEHVTIAAIMSCPSTQYVTL